jgi:hypothetical protein
MNNNLNHNLPITEEVNWDSSSEEDETSYDTEDTEDTEVTDVSTSEEKPEVEEHNPQSILKHIDSRVEIYYLKLEGDKAARTYINGLQLFIKEANEEKNIIKSIQKNLSTGYYKRINQDQTYHHGFNGDYKLRIQKLLITNYNIPKDKIFIKG